LLTRWRA